MSHENSPESSRSSGSMGGQSTPSSKMSADGALMVRRQPPSHVFNEEWFEIEYFLELPPGRGSQPPPQRDAEFLPTLHHCKTGEPVGPEVSVTVDPPLLRFPLARNASPRRKQRLRVRIRVREIRRDKAECYCIRLSPKEADNSPLRGITPIATATITLVNHKIKVQTTEEWEQVWYKDEGGRDKCMTVTAQLFDRNNKLYRGEQIPLQLTLYYANDDQPLKVTRQEILRTIGGISKQFVDKMTGKATIRFRVEDVSKNHQGQDFRVEVAPDAKVKGFKDVAPGFSPSVAVRSKRNKRHRPMASGGRQDHRLYSPSAPQTRMYSPEEPSRPETPASDPRVRDAVSGVMQWAEEVVNGLYPLQWTVIGYAQNPDGSPDYGHPYHNMPNPNAFISHILSAYSESIQEHLRVLSSAVEWPGSQDPYQMPGIISTTPTTNVEGFSSMPPHQQVVPVQGIPPFAHGVHPAAASEAFRDKSDMQMKFPPNMAMSPPPHHTMHHTIGTSPHHSPPPRRTMAASAGEMGAMMTHGMHQPMESDQDREESDVAYVLAKQYKALRTGERLGFPAYDASKRLLGFYRESNTKVGVGQFIPIEQHGDFGPMEILQAKDILQEAIANKSQAVYALKDWGSIAELLDNALVYEWSKDIRTEPNSGSSSGGSGD